MRITDLPVVVVLWTQEGCGACESVLDAWREIAAKYQQCLPSIRVDCDSHDAAAQGYRVAMTPTFHIMRYGRASFRKLEGAASPAEIEAFYQQAMYGLDCKIS